MNRLINRLWRTFFVTVFVLSLSGCGTKDVSRDPRAVHSIALSYIQTDFKGDIERQDDVVAVCAIKPTLQDDIPIAIVDYVVGADTIRDFFYFDYEQMAKVRNMMERKSECSYEDIATALGNNIWRPHAEAMKNIILRAKRGELPQR